MQLVHTQEGYPALLKTRTRTPKGLIAEETLYHGNRKTPWVYLTQNPSGRWQVIVFDGQDVTCAAGASTAAQVLPEFTAQAFALGILKRGKGMQGNPPATANVLYSLGSFVRIHGNRKERLP